MSDEILFIYTDGSTLKNGKKNSVGGIEYILEKMMSVM